MNSQEAQYILQTIEECFIGAATDGELGSEKYLALRRKVLSDPVLRPNLPGLISEYRSLSAFRVHSQEISGNWAGRRAYIHDAFRSVYDWLDSRGDLPIDGAIETTLDAYDEETVRSVWERAMQRRTQDPKGAITLGRTLLESVCKHILDERMVVYSDSATLPALYALTSGELNLAPSKHTEEAFKKILGGLTATIDGIANIRNKLSDSHGEGKALPARPTERHASLVVNTAGAVAMFLIETHLQDVIAGSKGSQR